MNIEWNRMEPSSSSAPSGITHSTLEALQLVLLLDGQTVGELLICLRLVLFQVVVRGLRGSQREKEREKRCSELVATVM